MERTKQAKHFFLYQTKDIVVFEIETAHILIIKPQNVGRLSGVLITVSLTGISDLSFGSGALLSVSVTVINFSWNILHIKVVLMQAQIWLSVYS